MGEVGKGMIENKRNDRDNNDNERCYLERESKESNKIWWFVLVSLFNAISNFMSYSMPGGILVV